MNIPRSAGVLLHPSSLPGPDGIGTLGAQARRFVDRLAEANQRWWQILPLNPPGPGASPYSSPSAFAINTMLVDLPRLSEAGWLEPAEIDEFHKTINTLNDHAGRCAFWEVEREKGALLGRAFERWAGDASDQARAEVDAFAAAEAYWLADYALYVALKNQFKGKSWRDWPAEFVRRDEAALERARAAHAEEIRRVEFEQWVARAQWQALRDYAGKKGVKLIGDIPIFVAMDSADAWAHREIFQLDAAGKATEVSGVPPDYFSKDGQKWGNPLYDWEAVAAQDYRWWLARVGSALATVDMIRIDHFRGFEAYWAVPAEAETAVDGRWRPGPGDAFFEAIRAEFGEAPFIAEDLGLITPEVIALRDRHKLPGMKVLQFANFDDPKHIFMPPNYTENFVAYTGTHDNDTTAGWYAEQDAAARHSIRTFLRSADEDVVRKMCEAVFESAAALAILPAQDIFQLGGDARMNDPSGRHPSWGWRIDADLLADSPDWKWYAKLTKTSGRA
ncbi:4-alpha-glucanotransferase [Bradymonas sediminis]|uniref:4-alpha-glucanotransferase n=1 Tax=Bradymonas sediminis TaxID=1548548 RepID=A0A2Z4FP43_9DELT|nr:4-alpha-glucanotransferase [Bradymonas sediminis]AWV90526.1 4-alpha-glucanotransferase [Bradymonas sediminis]TDP72081.1 4-alpha-glucanotransferase [Bradymonas sediminis]